MCVIRTSSQGLARMNMVSRLSTHFYIAASPGSREVFLRDYIIHYLTKGKRDLNPYFLIEDLGFQNGTLNHSVIAIF